MCAILYAMINMTGMLGRIAIAVYYYIYCVQNPAFITIFMMMQMLVGTIVMPFAPKVIEKLGNRMTAIISMLIQGGSMLVLFLGPATNVAFVFVVLVIYGLGYIAGPCGSVMMIDAWKKSGKLFTIGYQNRLRTDTQTLHKSCEAGELGEIYFAKAHALRRRAVPTWGVFPDKSKQGGGPLIDIGAHALDITLWMMNNYEPASVSGQEFYKLGRPANGPEGNVFGPWDPETFEVEDSAFGLVKMKNGATIYLEASWALNILKSMEASTTLCGTKAGAEIHHGGSYPNNELIYNFAEHGQLMEKTISPAGVVDFFEGGASAEGVAEQSQWLKAIQGKGEPLVKPEQAFVVTQILEGIYQSVETGKEVFF